MKTAILCMTDSSKVITTEPHHSITTEQKKKKRFSDKNSKDKTGRHKRVHAVDDHSCTYLFHPTQLFCHL